jgi:hypothetical protein
MHVVDQHLDGEAADPKICHWDVHMDRLTFLCPVTPDVERLPTHDNMHNPFCSGTKAVVESITHFEGSLK